MVCLARIILVRMKCSLDRILLRMDGKRTVRFASQNLISLADMSSDGFAGANKVFLAEFSMPLSGKTNATHPDLVAPDMSAFWFLNSEIDRTVQYGPCSCWPACGELDVFEILNSGNTRATTYLHMAPYGGSPHYFNRPTDGTVKVAVIFHNDIVHIQVLDDSTNFDAVVSGSTVSGWLKQECAIINPTGDVAH